MKYVQLCRFYLKFSYQINGSWKNWLYRDNSKKQVVYNGYTLYEYLLMQWTYTKVPRVSHRSEKWYLELMFLQNSCLLENRWGFLLWTSYYQMKLGSEINFGEEDDLLNIPSESDHIKCLWPFPCICRMDYWRMTFLSSRFLAWPRKHIFSHSHSLL